MRLIQLLTVVLLGISVNVKAQVADLSKWSNSGELIDEQAAIDQFELDKHIYAYMGQSRQLAPDAKVRVVEGDLAIDDHLLLDWQKGLGAIGLIVTGDLTVSGAILNQNVNSGPFLLVGGRTQARAIVGGGADLLFRDDAVVEELVVIEYNDGVLRFQGKLSVPVVIGGGSRFEIRGGLIGRWLNPFDEEHSWSTVLHPEIPAPHSVGDHEEFAIHLASWLLAGRPVLRSDLPPVEDYPAPFE